MFHFYSENKCNETLFYLNYQKDDPNGKYEKFLKCLIYFPDYLMEVRLEKEGGKRRKTLPIILQFAFIKIRV